MTHQNKVWCANAAMRLAVRRGNGLCRETVHVYGHRTLALLTSTTVYRSGTFVLHASAAIRWVSVTELDDYDFAAADLPIVRLLRQ